LIEIEDDDAVHSVGGRGRPSKAVWERAAAYAA